MAETIAMPKLGFDMAEGTLVRWLKGVGETVNKGEVLAEIETDKATVEVESSASGVLRQLLVEQGAVVPVGTPIAVVGAMDEKIEEPQKAERPTSKVKSQAVEPLQAAIRNLYPVVSEVEPSAMVMASPLAKRIAREAKVDLAGIKGTGPGGRIVRRDVETALSAVSTTQLPNYPTTQLSNQTVAMSKLRQAIGRRMTESKTNVPHFYITHEYKMDALMDLRAQFNKIAPENEKVSVNDFFLKATALTLRQFPNLNASLQGNSVLHHGAVNIGVAVSVEGGLLTVVCRDADHKPLRQIAAEVKAMAARAREGKVKPEDIEGSTFSVSNLGMYDVENFVAIINPLEAAILAVGSARELPVVNVGRDGNPAISVGWRMKATISVDHRVSDGVEAAKFMQALALYLEEPLRLVI